MLGSLAGSMLLLAACETRSLSQPYADRWSNRAYWGEMNEWDVVGSALPPGQNVPAVTLRKGQRVLLVQSGAQLPDDGMRMAVGKHFQVDGASGISTDPTESEHGLRGAAARGGYDLVIAYWGTIEVEREAIGSVAAWVPVVNIWATTSEQKARLRLRMIVLDTKTGSWRTVEAAPQSSVMVSSLASYGSDDSQQMKDLKATAYQAAGEALGAALAP
jgi:hypothetical protein